MATESGEASARPRRFRRLAAVAALVATTSLVSSGVAHAEDPPVVSEPPVSLTEMAQSIDAALGGGNTVGYAYAIAKGGQLQIKSPNRGWARIPSEGGIAMNPSRRIEVMSVTKNLTAAATLKLLEKLAPNTPLATKINWPVKPWLPGGWPQGAGWDKVTFRHLLAHTSGLGQMGNNLTPQEAPNWSTLWNGLRFAVSKNVAPGSAYSYTNMNYAMLRIIVPRLWRQVEPGANVPVLTSTNSGAIMLRYVNEKLLAPSGIAPTSCQATNAATATLAYNASSPQNPGVLAQLINGNAEACAGHRGLFLSALDLVRWEVYLAHGTVVSSQVRTVMDQFELGWQPGSNNPGNEGIFWHGGDGFFSGPEIHTCVMKFPGNIEASLVINSSMLSGSKCGVLLNSYNTAKG